MEKQSIQLGDRRLEFESGQRGAIRWAVGDPNGLRSGTWRLWGNKKGDVYLSVRMLGGKIKASLHKDGRCYYGLTSDYSSKLEATNTQIKSRHWHQWQLPDEPKVRAFQIIVPGTELREFKTVEVTQMRWLPAPAPNEFAL